MGVRSRAGASCRAFLVPGTCCGGRPHIRDLLRGHPDTGDLLWGRPHFGDLRGLQAPLQKILEQLGGRVHQSVEMFTLRMVPWHGTPPLSPLCCWSSSERKWFLFTSRSTRSVEKQYEGLHHQLSPAKASPFRRQWNVYTCLRQHHAGSRGAARCGLSFVLPRAVVSFFLVLHVYSSLIAGPFCHISIK